MILFTEFLHHRDEQIGGKNDYRSSDIATGLPAAPGNAEQSSIHPTATCYVY